jgi:cellulose 1,4-beta-cellobiosidase
MQVFSSHVLTIAIGQGVTVVAVVEPDSLANLVTNTDKTKCANAASTYRDLSVYAMKTLNDAGVYMYLDAGHAGWLGYPDNLSKAAVLFAELYKLAGSPKYVRGFATNVSNYNALSAATPDPITSGNNNYGMSYSSQFFCVQY